MTYPIIGFDLDDVLYPCIEKLVEFLRTDGYPNIQYSDFTAETFMEVLGVSQDGAVNINRRFQRLGLPLEHQPISGSQRAVARLALNHGLMIVTSRQLEYQQLTIAYLKCYFPAIKETFFGNHYAKQGDKKPKSQICLENGIELLIDDMVRHVTDCAQNGVKAILFGDYPWQNRELIYTLDPEIQARIQYAKNWTQVLQILPPE